MCLCEGGGWGVLTCARAPALQCVPCGRPTACEDHLPSKLLLTAPHHAHPQVRAELGGGAGLTEATLELFAHIVEKLPPTPSRFHYVFNPRDLSRVCEGLLRATPDK